MKRLLFALIVLLAAPAWACDQINTFDGACRDEMQLARMSGPMLGSGGSAAVCSTPSGDELSEGFGATPDNTWTAVTLTPEYGHTLQTGAPDGSCATGLRLVTSTSGGRERIYWNRGSTIASTTTIDIVFSFFLNQSGVDDGYVRTIACFGSTNEGGQNCLALKKSGASDILLASGSAASEAVTIAANMWYTITLHLDATAASSYFKVVGGESTTCDADAECAFTRDTTADPQYFVFGRNTYVDDLYDFEIGYITINTP